MFVYTKLAEIINEKKLKIMCHLCEQEKNQPRKFFENIQISTVLRLDDKGAITKTVRAIFAPEFNKKELQNVEIFEPAIFTRAVEVDTRMMPYRAVADGLNHVAKDMSKKLSRYGNFEEVADEMFHRIYNN